jgi:hypothetical protein
MCFGRWLGQWNCLIKPFFVRGGQVLLQEGVERSKLNPGQQLIYDMVNLHSVNFLFYAGTEGKEAKELVQGENRDSAAKEFACGGFGKASCGSINFMTGMPNSPQPKDPYAVVIGIKKKSIMKQVGTGLAGDEAKPGLNQFVLPVSYLIHEAAEDLNYLRQGNFEWAPAHLGAFKREVEIRSDLNFHIEGGFGGGVVARTVKWF